MERAAVVMYYSYLYTQTNKVIVLAIAIVVKPGLGHNMLGHIAKKQCLPNTALGNTSATGAVF